VQSGRSERKRRPAYSLAKRLIDLVGSGALLLVLSPLLVAVAIAIKLDSPGPIMFSQPRVGRYGRRFIMVKFRTMQHGADESFLTEHLQRLADLGEDAGGESAQLRLEEDPRVTRVGRKLRRWSLDELPNLWNVFTGPMSLVGPRPLVPEEIEIIGERARVRLEVKPGITGLAQVAGRDYLTIEERTKYDLEYVNRRSLGLDFEILMETARTIFRHPGS